MFCHVSFIISCHIKRSIVNKIYVFNVVCMCICEKFFRTVADRLLVNPQTQSCLNQQLCREHPEVICTPDFSIAKQRAIANTSQFKEGGDLEPY